MTELPSWVYSGTVPYSGDLSVLESALHSGRVAAAERGYHGEPSSIETQEAMQPSDDHAELLTAEQAEAAGVDFTPTVLRFQMIWTAES